MLVVTNPGSNLSVEEVARYGILLTAQKIMASGQAHETRSMTSIRDVDTLVRTSNEHPHVLGTSASEFVALFRDAGKRDREILVMTSSRKLIGSYDAAVAAVRTLNTLDASYRVRVEIVDSTTADVPTGMLALFCAESAQRGHDMATIADAARHLASLGRFAIIPVDVDYLAKSGRATFVKALAANIMQRVPFIEMVSGELKSTTTLSRSEDRTEVLLAYLLKSFGKGRPIWLNIAHGGEPTLADELLRRAQRDFEVRFVMKREISPGVYLSLGPKTLAMGAFPVDALPWDVNLWGSPQST